jgi:hypothetical protein
MEWHFGFGDDNCKQYNANQGTVFGSFLLFKSPFLISLKMMIQIILGYKQFFSFNVVNFHHLVNSLFFKKFGSKFPIFQKNCQKLKKW